MIIQLLFTDPALFLIVVIAILFAFTIHEYSHAQMADFLGDHTARHMGRLTINPIAHLDPMGALLILLVGFGWGKPVPFNPYNLRNQKWGPALVGLAGPGSNFIIAVIVGMILRFVEISNPMLIIFFSFFVWINILLGVFNLLPVSPLDGSHVFFTLFPNLRKGGGAVFLRGGIMSLLLAVLFMYFIGIPYICYPLFGLITGAPIPF